MRKILITSLGAGKTIDGERKYNPANYEIEGKIYENNNYISIALDKAHRMDKIFYIGTLGSMWEAVYKDYCEDNNIKKNKDYEEELEMNIMRFEDMNMEEKAAQNLEFLNLSELEKISNGKIRPVVTRYGLNSGENFENFNEILKIMEELEDGDKIYLDITHSFRSNALWMFLVTNYINNVSGKDIEIVSLTYGMFEATDKEKKITPVVDLNLFLKLTEWMKGAYSFEKSGNSELLVKLLDEEKNDLGKKMKNLSNSLSINYVASIEENIKTLKKHKELIDKLEGPAKLIVPKVVNDFLGHFSLEDENYILLLKLAKWHNKEGRYAMVYTNIQESIKSFVLEYLEYEKYENENEEYDVNNKKFNEFMKNIRKKLRKNGYIKDDTLGKELNQLCQTFDFCRKVRNSIAHSSSKRINPTQDIISIMKHLEVCERVYKKTNFLKDCSNRYGLEGN